MDNRDFFSRELIDAASQGSLSAVTALFDSSYNSVYKTIKTMVSDEDTIMDVIQDAYVKAIYNLGMLNEPKAFPAWVRKIAISNSAKKIKSTSEIFSQKDVENQGSTANDNNVLAADFEANPAEDAKKALVILDSLSPEQRLVTGMYYYTGMKISDIAATIECDENIVKKLIAESRVTITKAVNGLKDEGTDTHGLTAVQYLLFLFKGYSVNTEDIPFRESTFESVRFGLGLRFFKTEAKPKLHTDEEIENILSGSDETEPTEDINSVTTDTNESINVEDIIDTPKPKAEKSTKRAPKASKPVVINQSKKNKEDLPPLKPLSVSVPNVVDKSEIENGNKSNKIGGKIIALIVVLVILLAAAVTGVVYITSHSSDEGASSASSAISTDDDPLVPAEGTLAADVQTVDTDFSGIIIAYENALGGADAEKFVNTNAVNSARESTENESIGLYYAYSDIDADTKDELLIGVGNESLIKIAAVYESNDSKSTRVFKDNSIGDQSLISVLKDGTVFYHKVTDDKNAEAGIWSLNATGAYSSEVYTMDTEKYGDENYHKDDTSVIYNDLLAKIQETGIVNDFSWKTISAAEVSESSSESSAESSSESSEESSKEESSKEEKSESSKEESSESSKSSKKSDSSAPEGATDPYSIQEWADNYRNQSTGSEMYAIPNGDGNYTFIWWIDTNEYTFNGSVDGYQVVVNVSDSDKLYITPYSDHLDVSANDSFTKNHGEGFTGSFYKN